MTKQTLDITPFDERHLDALLDVTIRAWGPVFPAMRQDMPAYIYESFYPSGWEARQRKDITAMCRDRETKIWVAHSNGVMSGFVGLRAHEEDSMGEIYVIAVDPAFQRQGIGQALIDFAMNWMRDQGLAMAMVETGGDQGHAPARAAYEEAGFEQLPIARYFRKL